MLVVGLGLWLLCAGRCAVSTTWVRSDAVDERPDPAPETIDTRVLLVGDAGLARAGSVDPVLASLARDAAALPERTWVIFLGDNIYPHGLPDEKAPDRATAEGALRAQIDPVAASGAQIVFVSGNHDYAGDGWQGWKREVDWIQGLGLQRVRALPAEACPGPEVV